MAGSVQLFLFSKIVADRNHCQLLTPCRVSLVLLKNGKWSSQNSQFLFLCKRPAGAQIHPRLCKSQQAQSQKIKNRTIMWSNNPTPRYITKGNEISILKKHLYPMLIAALLTTARNGNDLSVNRWIDKENVFHTYNGTLFSYKKINPAICDNMGITWGHYAQCNNSD